MGIRKVHASCHSSSPLRIGRSRSSSCCIVASSLLTWFQPNPRNPLVRMLHAVVDPVLHPIRAILPSAMGMDFSPMVAILILWMLQKLLQGGLS